MTEREPNGTTGVADTVSGQTEGLNDDPGQSNADDQARSPTNVTISHGGLVLALAAVSAVLVTLSATTRLLGLDIGRFDVDLEASVPTMWSVLMIGLLAALLAMRTSVAKANGEHWQRWLTVTLCVTYVMIDESVSIHEEFIEPVRDSLGTSGVLYLAWIIPFGILALAIVAFLMPWILTLDAPLRNGLCTAGALFFFGAVAMEGIGGIVLDEGRDLKSDAFTITTTIEEAFEMAGVVVAIRTVFRELFGRGVTLSPR